MFTSDNKILKSIKNLISALDLLKCFNYHGKKLSESKEFNKKEKMHCVLRNWSKNLQMDNRKKKGETVSRLLYIYISLELEVARAELSDLRALDTLRGNKCASLRFHGGWYVVLVTACLFVCSLHDRGTSMNVITPSFIVASR